MIRATGMGLILCKNVSSPSRIYQQTSTSNISTMVTVTVYTEICSSLRSRRQEIRKEQCMAHWKRLLWTVTEEEKRRKNYWIHWLLLMRRRQRRCRRCVPPSGCCGADASVAKLDDHEEFIGYQME